MPALNLKASGQEATITRNILMTLIRDPEIISQFKTEHWTVLGYIPRKGKNFFSPPESSRQFLEPIQNPMQWVFL